MKQSIAEKAQAGTLHVGVVGTLNWLDLGVEMVELAGLGSAEAFPFRSHVKALRWLASTSFHSCDLIWQRGGGSIQYLLACAAWGKPAIKHWSGSDIFDINRGGPLMSRIRYWAYKKVPIFHLAVNQHVANRAVAEGIEVVGCVRNVTHATEAEILPMPEDMCILGYWRPGRRDFYGGDKFQELARRHPEWTFLVVGVSGEGEPRQPNVEYLGLLKDMTEVLDRSTVLVRMPQEDGAPNMPIEMLIRGRYVIYNREHPGCELARTVDEASEQLARISRLSEPNLAGAAYAREVADLKGEAMRFRDYLLRWCNR